MQNKIEKCDVDDVRTFWHQYGHIEGTEVVEIIDDRGIRSILIKETKDRIEKRSQRQNPKL